MEYSESFQALKALNEQVILGIPFLKNNNVILDFTRKCLYVGTCTRQVVYWQGQEPTSINEPDGPNPVAIPEEHSPNLEPIFSKFRDLFSDINGPATTETTMHVIRVNSERKVNLRPYPMSPAKQNVLYEQVQEMLERGVISPSSSPYSSPPVLVEKEGKRARFCIDFREINKITVDEAAILPKINDTIKDFGQAKIFTTLDLASGYWQIPLDQESKKYTAFSTPDGAHYNFNVMPFGLKCASATFQKLMTREVLTGYLHKFVKVYLDDIIIYSRNIEEHAVHMSKVFERLRIHNLKIAPEKCKVARQELEFLGHLITGERTTPLDKHVLTITDFSRPHTRKQVQSFLGTINWIREYLPRAAELIAPITQLLQKNNKFHWGRDQEEAFQNIKTAVAQPLSLWRPDHQRPFCLQTDASTIGIAAVLFQRTDEGERRVVSYFSSVLSPTERKYHINELEVLAVVTGIKKYREYLSDNRFTLITDSRALTWLDKYKDNKSKLMRWSLLIQEYSFDIELVPGKENLFADFLSRNPDPEPHKIVIDESRLTLPTANIKTETPILNHERVLLTNDELYNRVIAAQRTSRRINREKLRWQDIERLGPANPAEERFFNSHLVDEELWWHRDANGIKLVVSSSYIGRVLAHHHDSVEIAHPGAEETVREIKRTYYFNNMNRRISNYVRDCIICSSVKSNKRQRAAPLKPRSPKYPFETISIDAIGPLTPQQNDNRFIIVVEDIFTKWVEAKPVQKVTGKEVEIFLRSIFSRYGVPKVIISDNGPAFISNVFLRLCTGLRIQPYKTPIYHQRGNCVERRIQEFKKVIRTLMYNKRNKNDWEKYVEPALRILRTRKNDATGMTPAKALYGHELPGAGDWAVAPIQRERVTDAAAKRTRRRAIRNRQLNFNKKHFQADPAPPLTFRVGDRVMAKELRTALGEFHLKWTGPHEITKVHSAETYSLKRDGLEIMLHIDKLRPAPRGNPDLHDNDSDEPLSSRSEVSTISEDESSDDNDQPDLLDQPPMGPKELPVSQNEATNSESRGSDSQSQNEAVISDPGPQTKAQIHTPQLESRGDRPKPFLQQSKVSSWAKGNHPITPCPEQRESYPEAEDSSDAEMVPVADPHPASQSTDPTSREACAIPPSTSPEKSPTPSTISSQPVHPERPTKPLQTAESTPFQSVPRVPSPRASTSLPQVPNIDIKLPPGTQRRRRSARLILRDAQPV